MAEGAERVRVVEATYLHSENKGCGPRCMPFVPRNEGPRESIKSLLSTSFSWDESGGGAEMHASNYDDVSANFSRRGATLHWRQRAMFFDICARTRVGC